METNQKEEILKLTEDEKAQAIAAYMFYAKEIWDEDGGHTPWDYLEGFRNI